VLDDIRTDAEGERVLLVVHQVVVLLTRYVLEGMDEAAGARPGRRGRGAQLRRHLLHLRPAAGRMVLERYNEAAPLEEQDAPVTAEPDAPHAAADRVVTPRCSRTGRCGVADGQTSTPAAPHWWSGGSVSTPGAVLLTGLAALRVGAGKLQILTVEATAVALAVGRTRGGGRRARCRAGRLGLARRG
jgi:hypothetical protein